MDWIKQKKALLAMALLALGTALAMRFRPAPSKVKISVGTETDAPTECEPPLKTSTPTGVEADSFSFEASVEKTRQALSKVKGAPTEFVDAFQEALKASTSRRKRRLTRKSLKLWWESYKYADDTPSLSLDYHPNGILEHASVYDTEGTKRWRSSFFQNGMCFTVRAYDANGTERYWVWYNEDGSVFSEHTYDANGKKIERN